MVLGSIKEALFGKISNIGLTTGEFLANCLIAVILVIVGIFLGKLVKFGLRRGVEKMKIDSIIKPSVVKLFLTIVKWSIYILFLDLAIIQLDIPAFTSWLTTILGVMPALTGALIIITAGFGIAVYLKNMILESKLKDGKILSELDLDARQTNSEISRKVRLSKKGVEYRINQLINKNIVENFYPVVDFLKLGYNYNRVFIKLQFLNDSIRNQIEEYIKKTNGINWAVWFRGTYDLGLAFWTKKATEFKDRLLEFVAKFNDNIKDLHTSHVIQLDHYPYKIFKNNSNTLATMKETLDIKTIDKIDKKILLELNKNARLTSTQIARNINSNYKLVSYRIKRLIDNKILLASRAKINHLALGLIHYKIFAYINFKDIESIKVLRNYIQSLKQTIYIVDHTEANFLDFEIVVSSVEEFQDILNTISNKFIGMVKEFQHFSFGNTVKMSFLPTE